MVKVVKENTGVSLEYMKIYEKERMLKEIGYSEGREEGRAEGHVEGRIEEIIRLFCRFGKSKEETIEELMTQLSISKEKALEHFNNFK